MMRSRLLSPYTCPSTAPCCWVGVTPNRGTVILCWRALWKLDLVSMLALKSPSMDASHGRSESLLWCYLTVNLDSTRSVNVSALSVLWSAVSCGCLNLDCLCLRHPRTSLLPGPCWLQRHTCSFCPKYSALPCPAPPCCAPPCPALPCPALPYPGHAAWHLCRYSAHQSQKLQVTCFNHGL